MLPDSATVSAKHVEYGNLDAENLGKSGWTWKRGVGGKIRHTQSQLNNDRNLTTLVPVPSGANMIWVGISRVRCNLYWGFSFGRNGS